MDRWRAAAQSFVRSWSKRKKILGALICGSYVTGKPTKHSDIDLRIILDDTVNWRERGNLYVDGYLIEYFAQPLSAEIQQMEEEFSERKKETAHMLLTGELLVDSPAIQTLRQRAKHIQSKPFAATSAYQKEMAKYALWDMQDNLEEVLTRAQADFHYVYFGFLDNILWNYSAYLGYPELPLHKARRFLTDSKERVKYKLPAFPDKQFVRLFVDCLKVGKKEYHAREVSETYYLCTKEDAMEIHRWLETEK